MLLQLLSPLPLFTPKKKQHKYGKIRPIANIHFYHSNYLPIPGILGKTVSS